MMSDGSSPRTAGPVSDSGFTLLELLLALALAALLMAAMPGAIRLGTQALNQAEVLSEDAADRAALDFVVERLTETMVLYERAADGRLKAAFYGEANAIGFVAAAMMDPAHETPAGVFLMELGLADAGNGSRRLMLRWQPFRSGPKDLGVIRQERELLGNVAGLSFRYFGAPSARIAAAWSDVWTGVETVPEMVEMQVTRSVRAASGPWIIRVPLRLRPNR
jgi:prepilin-type N-terminal cleavage/methylation domain-containing protein